MAEARISEERKKLLSGLLNNSKRKVQTTRVVNVVEDNEEEIEETTDAVTPVEQEVKEEKKVVVTPEENVNEETIEDESEENENDIVPEEENNNEEEEIKMENTPKTVKEEKKVVAKKKVTPKKKEEESVEKENNVANTKTEIAMARPKIVKYITDYKFKGLTDKDREKGIELTLEDIIKKCLQSDGRVVIPSIYIQQITEIVLNGILNGMISENKSIKFASDNVISFKNKYVKETLRKLNEGYSNAEHEEYLRTSAHRVLSLKVPVGLSMEKGYLNDKGEFVATHIKVESDNKTFKYVEIDNNKED